MFVCQAAANVFLIRAAMALANVTAHVPFDVEDSHILHHLVRPKRESTTRTLLLQTHQHLHKLTQLFPHHNLNAAPPITPLTMITAGLSPLKILVL